MRGQAGDSTSIQFTWLPPPSGTHNGELLGYRVMYTESDSGLQPEQARQVTKEASADSVVLHNLDKWTAYNIWVLAFTSVGDGPHSDTIVVRTAEDGM